MATRSGTRRWHSVMGITLFVAGISAFPTAAAASGHTEGGQAGPVEIVAAVLVLLGVVLSGLRTVASADRVRRSEERSGD